jgi:hypothetical protein
MPANSPAQLIRACRGPVLLITLGGLLALHQSLGISFDKTFPVLIIVFGLMWLLERMVPRPIQVDRLPEPLPFIAPESLHVEREVYGIPQSHMPPRQPGDPLR